MQITLDEAIRHAMNIAEKQEELAEVCVVEQARDSCLKCANEHRQLAEWLRELQERRKQPEIIYCGECELKIECCRNIRSGGRKDDDFFSFGRRAERRTDG